MTHETPALDDAQSLTWPDHASYFSPGFEVLPSVTILKTTGTRSTQAISLEPPHLIALEKEGPGQPNRAFFMPIHPTIIPPARITRLSSTKDTVCNFKIEVNGLWKGISLSCAWIPLLMNEFAASIFENDFSTLDGMMATDLISVRVLDGQREIVLQGHGGKQHASLHPFLRGIAFPISFARSMVAPFLFSVDIRPRHYDAMGQVVSIPESFTLSFSFTKPFEAFIKRKCNRTSLDFLSFDIIPNAIPCANINYQYWHATDSYEDFQSTLSERPLGLCALLPFKMKESEADFLNCLKKPNSYRLELSQKKEESAKLTYSDTNLLKGYSLLHCADGLPPETVDLGSENQVILVGPLQSIERIVVAGRNGIKEFTLGTEQKKALHDQLPGDLKHISKFERTKLAEFISSLISFEYQCLYVWVSLGDKINGDHFRTPKATDSKLQFMQVLPQELSDLQTAIPCTGGAQFHSTVSHYTEPILLSFMPMDGHFLSEMTLMATIENLLRQISGVTPKIIGPLYELAVIHGIRQRVTVLKIESHHISLSIQQALQKHVESMAPIGAPLLLKFSK